MSKGSHAMTDQHAANAKGEQQRILIVEDEMMLALLLEDVVKEAGYAASKSARLPHALGLVNATRFDAAVLDVNLNGEQVFPVADALRKQGVPFLFASGYGDIAVPAEYRSYPVLQKPYGLETFRGALQELLGGAGLETSAR